jgi:uncharacterized protein YndB with AHSA1/START domain
MIDRIDFWQLIDAPAARVWRLLTDTRAWPAWGPSVRAVTCRDRFIRAGSRGRVQTAVGVWLPFVVTAFEPHAYWDWRVAGLTATGHRVDAVAPDRCRLTFSVPVWAAPYGWVCRLALRRIGRLVKASAKEVGQ